MREITFLDLCFSVTCSVIVVQADFYNGQAAAVSTAQVLCASLKTIIKNNHRIFNAVAR